jgi:hypothetical protein
MQHLNELLEEACWADLQRTITGHPAPVAERLEMERRLLNSVPREQHDTDEQALPRVDSKALATVRTNRYSVPAGLAGLRVAARVGATEIAFWHDGREVARHERLTGKHQTSAQLDHYLDLLTRKPGALARSLALRQERDRGDWPACFDELWTAIAERSGRQEAARQHLPGGSLTIVLVALAAIAWYRLKLGIFASVTVLYFGGLGSLQFAGRHVFYLEVFWWLALALCARLAYQTLWGVARIYLAHREAPETSSLRTGLAARFAFRRQPALRAAGLLTALTAMIIGGLLAARAYQDHHFDGLLANYASAQGQKLNLTRHRTADGNVVKDHGNSPTSIMRIPQVAGGPRARR